MIVSFIRKSKKLIINIIITMFHRNREECQILGYRIPKDTIIVSNVANVHTDPTYWIDPEQFCPERFLNSRGELEKPDYFIPFSTGTLITQTMPPSFP